MAKYRGLYGCPEGNESNPHAREERIADYAVLYGGLSAQLRKLVIAKRWMEVKAFMARLEKDGYADGPRQIILTSAMAGVRL